MNALVLLFACTQQVPQNIDKPRERVEKKEEVEKRASSPPTYIDVIGSGTYNSKDVCEQQLPTCYCPQPDTCFAEFESTITPIPPEVQEKMKRSTWREGCPVALDDLVLVTLHHWTEKGTIRRGELVVSKKQGNNISTIFESLYNAQFPIVQMRLMHHFNGQDDASMNANNTSAFNCRNIKNTNRYSQHSYGEAIDVNPLWNPWVKGTIVDPPAGKEYLNRTMKHPGVIKAGDIAVTSFAKYGWKWGGNWTTRKDYQHFSTSGK